MNKEPHVVAHTKVILDILSSKENAFYSHYLLNLPFKFVSNIRTAATNGRMIMMNPDFWMKLNHPEQKFLIMHEVLHIAYKHSLRRPNDDSMARLWNIACDYRINADLISIGMQMPTGGLYEPKYASMSAEAIYRHLLDDMNKSESIELPWEDVLKILGDSNTPQEDEEEGQEGKVIEVDFSGDIATPAELQAIESKLSTLGIEASTANQIYNGKNAGNIPGQLKLHLEEILKPKVDWRQVLSSFIQQFKPLDYSWRRPNRRRLHQAYLPSMTGNTLSRVDFAIDVSGSITKEMFTRFVSELAGIFKMMQPDELGVMQFDSYVTNYDVVKSVKEMTGINFIGGGGTQVSDVFKKFAEQPKSLGLVVLTDGYIFDLDELTKPKRPVIWVVWDNPEFVPPFGKTVHFKLD